MILFSAEAIFASSTWKFGIWNTTSRWRRSQFIHWINQLHFLDPLHRFRRKLWTSTYLGLEPYLPASKGCWCRELVKVEIRNLQSLLVCPIILWRVSSTEDDWIFGWRSRLSSQISILFWSFTFLRCRHMKRLRAKSQFEDVPAVWQAEVQHRACSWRVCEMGCAEFKEFDPDHQEQLMMRTRRRIAWRALTGSTMRGSSWRWTSRGTSVSLSDFAEQLDATDEHLARWQKASLNRSRASRRPRRSGRTSIRSSTPPNTVKLRRQQHVSSCSRKQFMSRSRWRVQRRVSHRQHEVKIQDERDMPTYQQLLVSQARSNSRLTEPCRE